MTRLAFYFSLALIPAATFGQQPPAARYPSAASPALPDPTFAAGDSSAQPGGPRAPGYVVGTNVVVAVSPEKNAVWGFSKRTGKWTKQEIDPPANGKLVPVLSDSVAGLHVGQSIYGYSGETGRWDLLRLPPGRKPQLSVDSDMIIVTDGQSLYTFADSTGKWSSPDANYGEAAADAVAADPAAEIPVSTKYDQLVHQYRQRLDVARSLAEQHRQLEQSNSDAAQRDASREQVRSAVERAFEARQQVQRAEVSKLRNRLSRVERLIESRDRIKERIIEHRVEELLNPTVRWPSSSDPASGGTLPVAPEGSDELRSASPGVPSANQPARLELLEESHQAGRETTETLAERVEAEFAKRQKVRDGLQGKWILARSKDDPQPQTLSVDENTWRFREGTEELQVGTVNMFTLGTGQLAIQFEGQGFARKMWLGAYELENDVLALVFESANFSGLQSVDGQRSEGELMFQWSGVYHRLAPEESGE